jgi:hypothetical protein
MSWTFFHTPEREMRNVKSHSCVYVRGKLGMQQHQQQWGGFQLEQQDGDSTFIVRARVLHVHVCVLGRLRTALLGFVKCIVETWQTWARQERWWICAAFVHWLAKGYCTEFRNIPVHYLMIRDSRFAVKVDVCYTVYFKELSIDGCERIECRGVGVSTLVSSSGGELLYECYYCAAWEKTNA